MRLTSVERKELLRIARLAIWKHLQNEEFSVDKNRIQGNLFLRCGAFVTIRLNAQLRGCIGYVDSDHALADTIAEIALKAASQDPRFMPVTQDEFDNILIEISVLSEIKELSDYSQIEIGKHGLYLEGEHYRGLLLPQVAVESKWDQLTFIKQLGRKAGIVDFNPDYPDVKIYTFTAEVFDESNIDATE